MFKNRMNGGNVIEQYWEWKENHPKKITLHIGFMLQLIPFIKNE